MSVSKQILNSKTLKSLRSLKIDQIKKILIHQANEKMDEAIIQRFYKLYNQTPPEGIMPMTIHKLGNSSVATVPTLYDALLKGEIENQEIHKNWPVTNKSKLLWHCLVIYQKNHKRRSPPKYLLNTCRMYLHLYRVVSRLPDVRF